MPVFTDFQLNFIDETGNFSYRAGNGLSLSREWGGVLVAVLDWRGRSSPRSVTIRGLQPRDLIPFIGSRSRVHEVPNRRRSLTLNMIRRLHEGLGIPAESLIIKDR